MSPIGLILAMEWSEKLSASPLFRITFLQLCGNCNQTQRFLHCSASRRISISHTRLITHAAFIPVEMMREDNPYCCSHYSTGFHSPWATQECQEGNLKGAQSCENKGRVLRRHAVRRIPQRPFEKSGSYPPTDWLHFHRHCLFMWQMGPINFIAGLTVIKLTKLAGPGASRHLEGSVAANHDRQMGVIFLFLFFFGG